MKKKLLIGNLVTLHAYNCLRADGSFIINELRERYLL